MTRLFAGTPWDRPPKCERCGLLETECQCPPLTPEPKRIPPEQQTARLRVEKRPKGKVATVVRGLDPAGNDLNALITRLKTACGAGGSITDAGLEIQGDHLARVETLLQGQGYRVKRG